MHQPYLKYFLLALLPFIWGCGPGVQTSEPINSVSARTRTALDLKNKKPLELRSPNFTLRANISAEIAKQLLTDLEFLRAGLLDRYSISNSDFDVHLDILFVENPEHYLAFAVGESSIAFYSRNMLGRKIIVNSAAAYQSKEDLWDILYHEYAHHFHATYLDFLTPIWLNEGLAQYAESFRITGKNQYEFGFDETAALSALKRQKENWLPIGPFLNEMKKYPIINGYYGDKAQIRQTFFYAQSWLLAHWMLHTEDGQKAYDALILTLDSGGNIRQAFPENIESILKDYTRNLSTQAQVFQTKDPALFDPVEITQKNITENDINMRLYLELSQSKGGKRRKIIETELRDALKESPEYKPYLGAIQAQQAFYEQRYSDSERLLASIIAKTDDPDILRLNAEINILWMSKFLRNKKARRANTRRSIQAAIKARPGDVSLDLRSFRQFDQYSQNFSPAQLDSLERILSSGEHKRSPLQALSLVGPLISLQNFDEANAIINRAELWGEKNDLGFNKYINDLREQLRLNKKYAEPEK